jgi:hypothetical protein
MPVAAVFFLLTVRIAAVGFVLQHIASLREVVVSQFFDLKSAAFFAVVLAATFAVTATQRTAAARVPVLLRTRPGYLQHVMRSLMLLFRYSVCSVARAFGYGVEDSLHVIWALRKVLFFPAYLHRSTAFVTSVPVLSRN